MSSEERILSRAAVSAKPRSAFGRRRERRLAGALRLLERAVQRTFDAVCVAAGLVALLPVFAAIGAAIKLEDGGPVFFRHPRVGKGFRTFGLLKFRSMVPHADRLGTPVTGAGDPRVTRVGRFLRKHKLDELPQLLNVLKGDLALVGARPEVERYVERFRAHYEVILLAKPGITDPATLAFRREEELLAGPDVEQLYVTEILPRKLALSLEYSRRRNPVTDAGVLVRTVAAILRGSRTAREQRNAAAPDARLGAEESEVARSELL